MRRQAQRREPQVTPGELGQYVRASVNVGNAPVEPLGTQPHLSFEDELLSGKRERQEEQE